jgi:dienelactone hydrolase
VLAGAAGDVSEQVDEQRMGLIGWSFGGWAALAFPEMDERCRAVIALAPGGNSRPLPGIIPAKLTFAWKRDVPTLDALLKHSLAAQHFMAEDLVATLRVHGVDTIQYEPGVADSLT